MLKQAVDLNKKFVYFKQETEIKCTDMKRKIDLLKHQKKHNDEEIGSLQKSLVELNGA